MRPLTRAAEQSDPAEEILNEAEAAIFQLSENRIGRGFMGVTEIMKEIVRLGGSSAAARAAGHRAAHLLRPIWRDDQRPAALGPDYSSRRGRRWARRRLP